MVSPYLLKPLRSLQQTRDTDAARSGETSRRRAAPDAVKGTGAVSGTDGWPDPEARAEPNAWTPAVAMAVPMAGAPTKTPPGRRPKGT